MCSQGGWTALHLAAQGGNLDVIRLLIEAQASLNIQTKVSELIDEILNILVKYFTQYSSISADTDTALQKYVGDFYNISKNINVMYSSVQKVYKISFLCGNYCSFPFPIPTTPFPVCSTLMLITVQFGFFCWYF